jgi:hypothetical protein
MKSEWCGIGKPPALHDRVTLSRGWGKFGNCMPRKKRRKRFRAVTAVKELARERVGSPPAGQIVIEKKRKPEKHKPTLGKLLEE